MAGTIYYNTKTTNTAEFTQKEFEGLKPQVKRGYRKAVDSEIALHEDRKGKKAVKDAKYLKRKKAQEREALKKIKAKAEVKATAEADKGTSEAPTSEGSE